MQDLHRVQFPQSNPILQMIPNPKNAFALNAHGLPRQLKDPTYPWLSHTGKDHLSPTRNAPCGRAELSQHVWR
jgi:hypothetical protein